MKDTLITDQEIQDALAKDAGEETVSLGKDTAFGFSGSSENFLALNNETQNGGYTVAETAKQKTKGEEAVKARAMQISETGSIASQSVQAFNATAFETYDDWSDLPDVLTSKREFQLSAEGAETLESNNFVGPLMPDLHLLKSAQLHGKITSEQFKAAATNGPEQDVDVPEMTAEQLDSLQGNFEFANLSDTPLDNLGTDSASRPSESASVNNFNNQAVAQNFVELGPDELTLEETTPAWEFDFNG